MACPLLKGTSAVVLDDCDFTSEVPPMTSWLSRLALLAALAPAAGCIIELGDGDDDPCIEPAIAYQRVRDPYTGQCYTPGGGGHCDGDDVIIALEKTSPLPSGGLCDTYCEGLDEYSCSADPGCHAAYVDTCPGDMYCSDRGRVFAGCWAIAPYAESGACQDLSAHGCAGRNDCSMNYDSTLGYPDPSVPWVFQACLPENPVDGVCSSNEECGPGYHCNLEDYCFPHPDCRGGEACPPVCYGKCEPDVPSCTLPCPQQHHCEVTCDYREGSNTCWATCVPDVPNGCERIDCGPGHHCEIECHPPPPCRPEDGACINTCGPTCVPDLPQVGECTGDVLCDALPPACPPSTVPGILDGCWSGYCIPTSECGHDPGHCLQPDEPLCRSAPPACPEGTVPGVENNCWSGYCIPSWACPEPPDVCASHDTEVECTADPRCTPYYDGLGCTCDASGQPACRGQRVAPRSASRS